MRRGSFDPATEGDCFTGSRGAPPGQCAASPQTVPLEWAAARPWRGWRQASACSVPGQRALLPRRRLWYLCTELHIRWGCGGREGFGPGGSVAWGG